MSDVFALVDRVVAQASAGEALEAFALDSTETTVKAHSGQVESLSRAQTRGVGIRVIDGGRVGFAYTTDDGDAGLAAALEQARQNAQAATPDEANRLAEAVPTDDLPALYDPRWETVTADEKVAAAVELEAATLAARAPVKAVEAASYGDGVRSAAIASTAGVRETYRRSDAYLFVEALAERDGAMTSAYGLDMARTPQELDVPAAAGEAATRAVRLLGGRKPASAKVPVVFDPLVTASFLGVLAGALTAEAVQRGRSLFAGRVGEQLAPEHVGLTDDGRHPDGPASAPWDGEGTATGRTTLLDAGVLSGFLHNVTSAARDGVASTGNATRASFKSLPGLGPSNLFLQPGSDDLDSLLAAAGEGFYVQQVMGIHSGANPISGEFSVGAAGVMIRDGAFAEPVREATIASTIPDILSRIRAMGSDLRFFPFSGGMGGTSVLIEQMTLAGA